MNYKESKLLLLVYVLGFCFLNDATETQSKLFQIKSGENMQRSFKSVSKNGTTEPSELASFRDIFNSYLYAMNKNEENFEFQNSTSIFQNERLNDMYVSLDGNNMILQNVEFVNFRDFLSSPVKVEMKIDEISNHQNVQINSSINGSTALFTSEMIFLDQKYILNASLTNPIFHYNELILKEKSHSEITKEVFEIFEFDKFLVTLHPKDMFSMTLNKTELRSSTFLRLADTWLPPVADWLRDNLTKPKILEYEKQITDDGGKFFFKKICDLIKRKWNVDIAVKNMPQFDTGYERRVAYESIILENIGDYTDCDGDSMMVKKSSNSSSQDNVYWRHNVSIALNYAHNNFRISAKQIEFSLKYSSYNYSPEPALSCSGLVIKKLDVNISFNVKKGETSIQEIINSDISLDVADIKYSNNGCKWLSNLKYHVLKNLNEQLLGKLTELQLKK